MNSTAVQHLAQSPQTPIAAAADECVMTHSEALLYAQVAHRNGDLDVAERFYRTLLDAWPDDVDALHFLGVLLHQRGDSAAALEHVRRALALAPDEPGIWNNLGNVLLESGDADAAIEAYRRCLMLVPGFADAHNNIGTIQRSRGEWDLAEASYRCALDLEPERADSWHNLAGLMLARNRIRDAVVYGCKAVTLNPRHAPSRNLLGVAHAILGEFEKAAAIYREWLIEEPDNPIARHHLAACTGESVPGRASDGYVEKTFDEFAQSFDAKLEQLQYRAPQLVGSTLTEVCGAAAGTLDILDAGCGTGLCGPLVRAHARELTGVDLSAGMLQRAQLRGVYDRLHKAELTHYLSAHADRWDVILSADTLCYFGELADFLKAAYLALRGDGWLLFTVEALTEASDAPFRLQANGRYVHARDYVETALAGAGFEEGTIASEVLRKECGEPVAGWVVVARKPAGSRH